jgi:hypothetical protein
VMDLPWRKLITLQRSQNGSSRRVHPSQVPPRLSAREVTCTVT